MKQSTLVRNQTASTIKPVDKVQTFTCNFLPGSCRYDTLEGRQHLVVPMVMLTEGVHAGTSGPLFYSADELAKTPECWNHKPVVVYHPEMNGQGISACSPEVINNRKVGIVLNTKFENGRLKAEAWIEKPRAESVDERIMAAITQNEMMEVSTGVFLDQEPIAGEFNGKPYNAIARNFRPDHLAILPDQIGACSIAAGAGLLRNAAQKDKSGKLLQEFEGILKKIGITTNEMSFDNIRQSLNDVLRARFSPKENGPFLWVDNVYSNFVVYEFDGTLFRIGYTATDTGVTLSEDKPTEVVRVTEYRTVQGAFVGNRDQQKKEPPMNDDLKKKIVDSLIANKDSGWSEQDRPTLVAMKDAQLTALSKSFEKKEVPATTTTIEPVVPAVVTPTTPTTNTTVTPPVTPQFNYEAWLKSAPAPVQEMVSNGVSVLNEEKLKLIETITANVNNVFTKEQLSSRPLSELRGMARLCAPATTEGATPSSHFYGGQGTVTSNAKAEEALELPVMNFEPASAGK